MSLTLNNGESDRLLAKHVPRGLSEKEKKTVVAILTLFNVYKRCLFFEELKRYCSRYYATSICEALRNALNYLKSKGFIAEGQRRDSRNRVKSCYQRTVKELDEWMKNGVTSYERNVPFLYSWYVRIENPLVITGASKGNYGEYEGICDQADISDALASLEIIYVLHLRKKSMQSMIKTGQDISEQVVPTGIPLTSQWYSWFGKEFGKRDLIVIGSPMVNYVTKQIIDKAGLDIRFEYDCRSKRVSSIIVANDRYGSDHGIVALIPNVFDAERSRLAMIIAGGAAYSTSSLCYSLSKGSMLREMNRLNNVNVVVAQAIMDQNLHGFYGDAKIVKAYML